MTGVLLAVGAGQLGWFPASLVLAVVGGVLVFVLTAPKKDKTET